MLTPKGSALLEAYLNLEDAGSMLCHGSKRGSALHDVMEH